MIDHEMIEYGVIRALSSALFIPEHMIKVDSKLSELKSIDSLTFEALVTELSDNLGITLDPEYWLGIETVSDLISLSTTLITRNA